MKLLVMSRLGHRRTSGRQGCAGFGQVAAVEGGHERPHPDRTCKVVFDLSPCAGIVGAPSSDP